MHLVKPVCSSSMGAVEEMKITLKALMIVCKNACPALKCPECENANKRDSRGWKTCAEERHFLMILVYGMTFTDPH